jgi:hypothetical protein
MILLRTVLLAAAVTAVSSPAVAEDAAASAVQPASVAFELATLPSATTAAEPKPVPVIAPLTSPDQPAAPAPRPAARIDRGDSSAVPGMLRRCC